MGVETVTLLPVDEWNAELARFCDICERILELDIESLRVTLADLWPVLDDVVASGMLKDPDNTPLGMALHGDVFPMLQLIKDTLVTYRELG